MTLKLARGVGLALPLCLSAWSAQAQDDACLTFNAAAEQVAAKVMPTVNAGVYARLAIEVTGDDALPFARETMRVALEGAMQDQTGADVKIVERHELETIVREFERSNEGRRDQLQNDIKASLIAVATLRPAGGEDYSLNLRVVELTPTAAAQRVDGDDVPCVRIQRDAYGLGIGMTILANRLRQGLNSSGFHLRRNAVLEERGASSEAHGRVARELKAALADGTQGMGPPISRATLRVNLFELSDDEAQVEAKLVREGDVLASGIVTVQRADLPAWQDDLFRAVGRADRDAWDDDRQAVFAARWLARAGVVAEAVGGAEDEARRGPHDPVLQALRSLEYAIPHPAGRWTEADDSSRDVLALELETEVTRFASRDVPRVTLDFGFERLSEGQDVPPPRLEVSEPAFVAVYSLTNEDEVVRLYPPAGTDEAVQMQNDREVPVYDQNIRFYLADQDRAAEVGAFVAVASAGDRDVLSLAPALSVGAKGIETVPTDEFLDRLKDLPPESTFVRVVPFVVEAAEG